MLESSTHTTSPPELNTSVRSSLGGCVQTLQILGGGQQNPIGAQLQQLNSSSAQPQQTNSSSEQQNPPLHRSRMGDDIKLPIFRGTGVEDPNQHFFLCEAVWNIKQVQNDDIKKAQLTTTFRDKALTWFMKFSTNTQQPKTIKEIKDKLKK